MAALNLHNLHSQHEKLAISRLEAGNSVPILKWRKINNTYEGREKLKKLKKHEAIWARDPTTAILYADQVLEGPFKLGEPIIAKSAADSYDYAENVLHGRFKLGEPAIAKDTNNAYNYALHMLKGPFKLGEPAIARGIYEALNYAKYCLEGPFKLGEPTIVESGDPYTCLEYARIIDGPFKLGEPVMRTSDRTWRTYCNEFGVPM